MSASSSGFTILELLATLTVFAIILLLAIPAARDVLAENRTTAEVNTLVSGLSYARSEAITSGQTLTFCKSSNHKTCGGQWRDGQIILDSKGTLLRVFAAIPVTDNLTWNGSGGKDDAIVWTPSGYTKGQRGTFYYCVANGDVLHSRAVVLWDTGRVYTSAVSEGDYVKYCS